VISTPNVVSPSAYLGIPKLGDEINSESGFHRSGKKLRLAVCRLVLERMRWMQWQYL
jgi:hypothetical protein